RRCTAQRLDAEELGEAEVVTDAHPERQLAGIGDDDLPAGTDRRRLLVREPLDVDVEEMDLPVDRGDLTGAVEQARGVRQLSAIAPLDDAAGDEPDPETLGKLPRPADRGAVEGFRPVAQLAGASPTVEQLRQDDELRAGARRLLDQTARSREVPVAFGRGG